MDHKKITYTSEKVLGKIYDRVSGQNLEFIPDRRSDFDQRILNRFELDESTLETARSLKMEYDKCVRRILAQHTLDTEFELWTGFAMSKPAVGSDYKRQEQLGREYDAVKQRFRELCYDAAGGHQEERLDPFVAAMYKVTEEDVKVGSDYDPDKQEEEDDEAAEARKQRALAIPLISFPWIFHWVMIRIVMGDAYTLSRTMMTARPTTAASTDPQAAESRAAETKAPAVVVDSQEVMEGPPPVTAEPETEKPKPEGSEAADAPEEQQEALATNDAQGYSAVDLLVDMGRA
jgi:RNA-dependent RNA polymerase